MPDDENVSREHGNILNALGKRIRIEECSKHRTYFQKRLDNTCEFFAKKSEKLEEVLRDWILPRLRKHHILTGDDYEKVRKKLDKDGDSKFKGSGVLGQSVPRNIMKEPTDEYKPIMIKEIDDYLVEKGFVKVKKADLEFLFKYGDGNYESCGHDDDDFNDLKKKHLEDADEKK